MRTTNIFKTLAITVAIGLAAACNQAETADRTETNEDRTATDRTTADRAQEDRAPDLSEFAREAASDGMMEVRMADLAMDKARNNEVRQLAERIRRDHQQANRELEEIARAAEWDLPDRMMDEHREKLEELQNTASRNFDRQYLEMMVEDHEEAIDKFERAAERLQGEADTRDRARRSDNDMGETAPARAGTQQQDQRDDRQRDRQRPDQGVGEAGSTERVNQQLQTWIDNTLPVLRQHLERSQQLLDRMEQA